jgi:TRAP-type C4-dicarboxylate transport system permease small subunit
MYRLIQKFVFWANTLLFSVATILCIVSVLFRYGFNNSIVWSEEVVRFLFVVMFFFGATEACRLHKHVVMDIFVSHLPEKAQNYVQFITNFLLIIFLLAVAFLGLRNSIINMAQHSPALGIPYGVVYASIPIGCLLMSIMLCFHVYDNICVIRRRSLSKRGV